MTPEPPFAYDRFPHCDQAVLHAPGECVHCDRNDDWQTLRRVWGIAFTGHLPASGDLPCPSDHRRGTGGAHTWGGNLPSRVAVPREQSFASKIMYGWHRDR